MNTVKVQFLDEKFHRVLFDAMPTPILVVDSDVCVLDYNQAADPLVGAERKQVLRRRGGEVLHCLHATDSGEGCGRGPLCSDCIIRKCVTAAAKGEHSVRKQGLMELLKDGKRSLVRLKVSCHPFDFERHSFVLLILEGLGD